MNRTTLTTWAASGLAAAALAGCASTAATTATPLPVIAGQEGVVTTPPDVGLTGRLVKVERVVDGDTLAVSGDERIRLLSIQAPELNSRTKADDAECGAQEARDALASLLPIGTEVRIAGLPGEPAQDRYQRTLANVYLEDGTNASLWLVEHGWAVAYMAYRTVETDEAVILQAGAQNRHAGQWGLCR